MWQLKIDTAISLKMVLEKVQNIKNSTKYQMFFNKLIQKQLVFGRFQIKNTAQWIEEKKTEITRKQFFNQRKPKYSRKK